MLVVTPGQEKARVRHEAVRVHYPSRRRGGCLAARGAGVSTSEAVVSALLRDFSMHGQKAIAKVRRTQPAAYLKILALLVPREHKVEHSNPIKDMTTEQIERSIEFIKEMIAKRDAAANAKVIEGEAEVVPSLPAPGSGGTKMPKT